MKKLLPATAVLVVTVLIICVVGAVAAVQSEKGQVCVERQPDNLVGCLLAGPLSLNVTVSGSVDEVRIYRADDDQQPVATILTNGRDTSQTVSLPTVYRYYYVTRKGEQTHAFPAVGFNTSQSSATLTIRSLNEAQNY